MRFSRAAVVAASLLVVAACGDSTGPSKISPRDTATTLIAEPTKVVDPASSGMGAVADGRIAFGASSTEAAKLQVGDIIASGVTAATPDGLLRKVTAKTVRSDSIIITTGTARLTEAIERGEASFDAPLELDDPAGQSEPGITLSRGSRSVAGGGTGGFTATFVDYDIKGLAKVSGTLTLSPALKLDTKFADFALDAFTFKVTATTTSTLSVKSVATGTLEGSYPIKTVRMRPVTLLVGAPPLAVPIVVVPTVVITVKASGTISAGIETSITGTYTTAAGATWKSGAWTPVGESAPTFTFKAPRPKLDATAKISLGPRFSLSLYTPSLFDAYADLTGYVKAEVTVLQDPFWKLSSGIDASVGLTSSLFDTKFVNLNSVPVITKEWLLAAGHKVTILPEKNDTARKAVAQNFTASMASPPAQARYTWTFGDGSTDVVSSNNPSVSHTFANEGTFQVGVTVEDVQKGYEVGHDTAMVKVSGPPVATVTVSPSPIEMIKGLAAQMTATLKDNTGVVLANRVVKWASSVPSVATVDSLSGLVSAIAVGTATITATSEGKSGSSIVTVVVPDSVDYYKNLVVGNITTTWYYGATGAWAQTDHQVFHADGSANTMSSEYADGHVGQYDLTGPNSIRFSWYIEKQSDGYYLRYSFHSGKLKPGSVNFRTDGIAGGYYYSTTSK